MAQLTVIEVADAPKRPTTPKGLRDRMAQYENYVMGVKKGQVGKLIPSDGESSRAVAVRVSRAGKRIRRPLDVWSVGGAVYFRPAAP